MPYRRADKYDTKCTCCVHHMYCSSIHIHERKASYTFVQAVRLDQEKSSWKDRKTGAVTTGDPARWNTGRYSTIRTSYQQIPYSRVLCALLLNPIIIIQQFCRKQSPSPQAQTSSENQVIGLAGLIIPHKSSTADCRQSLSDRLFVLDSLLTGGASGRGIAIRRRVGKLA